MDVGGGRREEGGGRREEGGGRREKGGGRREGQNFIFLFINNLRKFKIFFYKKQMKNWNFNLNKQANHPSEDLPDPFGYSRGNLGETLEVEKKQAEMRTLIENVFNFCLKRKYMKKMMGEGGGRLRLILIK